MELDVVSKTFLDHIYTKPNYISKSICEALANDVDSSSFKEIGVLDMKANKINDMDTIYNRDVRYVTCGTNYKTPELVNGVIQTLVENLIEPTYNVTVHYWEWPQLLVYPKDGGHYKPHVDGEYEFTGNDGNLQWKRISDRDISLLIYLNDDYEGGEVVFPDLNMTITPKQGQVLAFPSNRNFRHGVTPVLSNLRKVIVTWITVWGTPRVIQVPPPFQHVMRGHYSSFK